MSDIVKNRRDLGSKHARRLAAKRVIDTALIAVSAPVTIPVAVATAAAVRMKLGSPVLFKQVRIGLDEKPFTLLKFRSMLAEVGENGELRTPDQRITSFGRALRKSSLDELPQLINVLRGDMALVGPRPLLPKYLPYYYEHERLRHAVRPGITGLAQVTGRNHTGWDQRLAQDTKYATKPRLGLDVKILFQTLMKVVSSSDVAIPGDGADYLCDHRSYPRFEGIALRRFERSDVPLRVNTFTDPTTLEFMRFPETITLQGTYEWLAQARKDPLREDLVLYEVDSGDVLAFTGYRCYELGQTPVTYIAVVPGRHGKGYGSLAIRLLVEHMAKIGSFSSIAAELYRSNIGSKTVFERSGFVEVPADLPPDRMRLERLC